MRKLLLFLAPVLITTYATADSLDRHYDEIKTYGGLTALCKAKAEIDECSIAIGEWKPALLEKVKAVSPFCIDTCKHDMFAFVQSSVGDREYPMVATKDFTPSAVSRGVEVNLFPVAVKLFHYRACNGCNHVQTFPAKLTAELSGSTLQMPMIGRGIFYIPSQFRRYVAANPSKAITLSLELPDGEKVSARLSVKALQEYSKMLRALDYDKVP